MAKNLLNSVKLTRPKKSVFDLSHDVKLSGNLGQLIPTMCMEVVPGDKFNIGCESLIRFSPLVSPVMHRMNVYMHYFFVPNRILWHGWENFIMNKDGGAGVPQCPFITFANDGSDYSDLADYLGIPTPTNDGGSTMTVSALPFAAYQAIWSEFYRDQNLQTEAVWQLQSGGNNLNTSLRTLRRRCWEHDYFTAALPTAQADSAVEIPLGDVELKMSAAGTDQLLKSANDYTTAIPAGSNLETGAGGILSADVVGVDTDAVIDPNGTLEVGATSINDLRRAFRLQEWLERSMRGGRRYVENILVHFGLRAQDSRLQRPEYITGTKSPVMISEVLNTTGTEDAPQGNMAGHGVSVTSGKYGDYFCQEHGYIIGVMSVMPRTAYQQGIPKHFLKYTDFTQYYWPSFANLGEQPVEQQEIMAFKAGAAMNGTFGYVPRYTEYKYAPSRVAGDFRTSLDFWHMGRIFDTHPQLNSDFVTCTPDDRIFAVTDPDVQKLYCHVYHKVRAVRPMPYFGTPTI